MSETAAPPCLSALDGQPRVRRFLADALAQGRVGAAYLFCGTTGDEAHRAAVALAQALVCPRGGCGDVGSCDDCRLVAAGDHPDVTILSPDSATGYRIDQVRDKVIARAQKTPVRAASKVFVLERADQLRGVSANALLKTIEEPPGDTHFILCAPTPDLVLSTIVSRCQVVPFAPAAGGAVSEVAAAAGASEAEAAWALSVCPAAADAAALLASGPRRAVRDSVVDTLGRLGSLDDWGILQAAGAIAEAAAVSFSDEEGPMTDEERTEQEREREERDRLLEEYLTRGALKARAEQEKREDAARERSGIMEAVVICESVLHDALVATQDRTAAPVNSDAAPIVASLAAAGVERVAAACEAAERAAADIAHNVTPRLAVEAMLLAFKEALCPASSR